MKCRLATPDDIEAIAALHADSWQRNYRGAYSDAFLDGPVVAERLEAWTERLTNPRPDQCTIVADDGGLVGFAHTELDDDPMWGALLDNLHVAHRVQRRGIGAGLMSETAAAVLDRRPGVASTSGCSSRTPGPRRSTSRWAACVATAR